MLSSEVLRVARSYLGVKEQGQNSGPDVEKIIRNGGGDPSDAPPWCAYFVTAVVKEAETNLSLENAGKGKRIYRSGSAVSIFQKTQSKGDRKVTPVVLESLRDWYSIGWTGRSLCNASFNGLEGSVMVRTRTSRPVSDKTKALKGNRVNGHAGIVERVWIEDEKIHIQCICGNSSGDGHAPGTGSVARELIVEGTAAWSRLLGLVATFE